MMWLQEFWLSNFMEHKAVMWCEHYSDWEVTALSDVRRYSNTVHIAIFRRMRVITLLCRHLFEVTDSQGGASQRSCQSLNGDVLDLTTTHTPKLEEDVTGVVVYGVERVVVGYLNAVGEVSKRVIVYRLSSLLQSVTSEDYRVRRNFIRRGDACIGRQQIVTLYSGGRHLMVLSTLTLMVLSGFISERCGVDLYIRQHMSHVTGLNMTRSVKRSRRCGEVRRHKSTWRSGFVLVMSHSGIDILCKDSQSSWVGESQVQCERSVCGRMVFEHGQSSDPSIASFSQVQETNDAPSTSTNMEDKPLGGSFHASPLRSTPASPAGHTSGGAEPLITLTALSSVVSTLVQRVNLLETELKDSKQLFKDVVEKLVKQVKAMEVKLKTKKRKVVVSDFDKEDGGEQDVDLDALHALANADVTVMSLKSPGCPFTVSPGIKLSLPEALILPAAEPMPARVLLTTLLLHNQLQRCQKERLQAQELADLEKQRAESLMKDANLARQMSQDFEMTEDQRKRHKSSLLIKALLYTLLGWTIASISKTLSNLHPETASEEEFDKIQRAVAFTKGLKRDGSPMTNASSKKLKNGDVEVDVEAPSHGVPQEIEKLKSSFYEFPRES
ncbi:hypothetical protein Tco_0663763 [Tanacetum coccineum]